MEGGGSVGSGSAMDSTGGSGKESTGGAEGHDGEAKIITGWITCKGWVEGCIGNGQKREGSDCEPMKDGSTARGSEVDCSASLPGVTVDALVVAVDALVVAAEAVPAAAVVAVAAVAAVAAAVVVAAAAAAAAVAAVVAAAAAAAAAAAVAAIELGSLKAL